MSPARSYGGVEAERSDLETVDGKLQPTRLTREEMSAAIDGALERVFAVIEEGGAPSATRRILLKDLIAILDERLEALDREAGLPTRSGADRQVAARLLEQTIAVKDLRRRAVAALA